jgi:membrane protein DedA with SNARE-associated domain
MIEGWTAGFETWLRANAGWTAAATFVIAFLESLPIISLLVPSTALLLAIGALIGAGLVSPVPALLACVAGGILGDAVGYWVARAVGPYAIRRRLPASCRRPYAWSIVVFRRWGWWAVFIGRFFGPARAVAPLAAGVVGMKSLSFQSANILSALIWAPALMLPGTIGAWLVRHFGQSPDPLAIAGLLALVLLGFLAWQRLRPALARFTARR